MTRADSRGTAIISWHISMRCIPALTLKAYTRPAIHECLYTKWLSYVDLDNGLEDLVWTILLGPERVGDCRQG